LGFKVDISERPLSDIPHDFQHFLDYWKSITPTDAIGPRWTDFELLKVPHKFLPTAVVVDYDETSNTFRYRYWGSHLTPIFGKDYTGGTFDDLPDSFKEVSFKTYGFVVERKRPCFIEFSVADSGKQIILQNALRVPLSEDRTNVNGIVSLIVFDYHKNELERMFDTYIKTSS